MSTTTATPPPPRKLSLPNNLNLSHRLKESSSLESFPDIAPTGTSPSHLNANGLTRSTTTTTLSTRHSSTVPLSARAAARRPSNRSSTRFSISHVPRSTTMSMSAAPTSSPSPNPFQDDEATLDDARAESAALISELKEQVRKAELVSDQYQKQLGVLQLKLDEAVSEQTRLEEQAHEKDDLTAQLGEQVKDLSRQLRDLDAAFAGERMAMVKDREERLKREEELQDTIGRLKETIALKDASRRNGEDGDASNAREGRLSPNSTSSPYDPERSPSRSSSKLLLQKDKIIESLRLELASTHMKIEELEHLGGLGRLHDLENQLIDARMNNARLLEDNESYQLLLSDRALRGHFNGDFVAAAYDETANNSKRNSAVGPGSSGGAGDGGLGSLAEELESVESKTVDLETHRKLEAELKNVKDSNKALTLYIEKIIGRLLQHDGYENILAKNEDEAAAGPKNVRNAKNKPAPAGTNDAAAAAAGDRDHTPSPTASDSASQTGIRSRPISFRSTADMPLHRPKTRTVSAAAGPAGANAGANAASSVISHPENPQTFENPQTAPRISFHANRVRNMHRRVRSEQHSAGGFGMQLPQTTMHHPDPNAASVVGQMYRGPPLSTGGIGGGPLSPSSLGSPLSMQGPPSLFSVSAAAANANANANAHTGVGGALASAPGTRTSFQSSVKSTDPRRASGTFSFRSDRTGDTEGGGSSSAGRAMNNYMGAVTTQNKLRPLRLVQDEEAAAKEKEAARKKANRGSWISWFKKDDGVGQGQGQGQQQGQ